MNEMEQAVKDLVHLAYNDVDTEAAEQDVLSLYATAIRERDEAMALAVQAGRALKRLIDLMTPEFRQVANDDVLYAIADCGDALAAIKAAGLEV